VGNIGNFATISKICHKHKVEIIDIAFKDDYALAKNELLTNVKNGWILFLEPADKIVTGFDVIESETTDEPKSFKFNILSNGVLTKEIRLWHVQKKLSYFNPIFETIEDESAAVTNVYIVSKTRPDLKEQEDIILKWRKNKPLASSPYYYHACVLLAQKKYKDFLSVGNHYLFLEKTGISAIMMKYYIAMIKLYIFENCNEACNDILACLIAKPTMAEFWCLLGDVYYKLQKYDKAICFYENAILIGEKRFKSDDWPVEIQKYSEYPTKMIKSCKLIRSETTQYQSS